MLIKEYRIPLPLTVEEYRIAQLYMIAVSVALCTFKVSKVINPIDLYIFRKRVEKRVKVRAAVLKSLSTNHTQMDPEELASILTRYFMSGATCRVTVMNNSYLNILNLFFYRMA